MGYKKIVTLACDGPCGLALPDVERAPAGWVRLMAEVYEHIAPGQGMYLCPECALRLQVILNREHYAWSKQYKGGKENG